MKVMLDTKIVSDPKRIVTDELILRHLARVGIDKDYVELWHDYSPRSLGKEYNPYAKFYRDLKSGIKIMAVGGLPMVNADGVKICGDSHNETKVGWEQRGNKLLCKPNIFGATVDRWAVELVALNDQPPIGAKKGDSVSWEPRLFLNGVEQYPHGLFSLLPTDPVNEHYHNNVLGWDYDICKRRIRVIEGRFRERWIFPANPNGDVRIKHNFVGSLKVKLGYAMDAKGNPLEIIVTDDEELIPATSFTGAVYPVEIGASQTFYPDPGHGGENTSVDGGVQTWTGGRTWTEIVQASPGDGADDEGIENGVYLGADALSDEWIRLFRLIFLFDTSGLPDGAIISAAVLSLYGSTKTKTLIDEPDVNIYASTPSSNTALQVEDYAEFGTTPFCDTPITYTNWKIIDPWWNDFTLNAAGRAAISKIGVSKFGTRNANFDVAEELDPGNHSPTWGELQTCTFYCYQADKGTIYKPKLVVTYSVPPATPWRLDPKPRTRIRFHPTLKLG